VMEYYKPTAVVLQCGGDSLSGDRLGCFNLSMRGHANCVQFVKSFGLPTLILGGGGYTMRNVARTWAYETGQLVGVEMGPDLPFTDYYEYYSPDFELDVKPSNMDNANSMEYLEKIKAQVLENLKRTTQHAPSVQMQEVPREPMGMNASGPDGEPETLDEREDRLDDEEADAEASKDKRYTQRLWDKKTECAGDLEDSDDEEIAEANGVRQQPGQRRRRIGDYQNPHAPPVESGANSPVEDSRSVNGDAEDAMDEDAAPSNNPANGANAAAGGNDSTKPSATGTVDSQLGEAKEAETKEALESTDEMQVDTADAAQAAEKQVHSETESQAKASSRSPTNRPIATEAGKEAAAAGEDVTMTEDVAEEKAAEKESGAVERDVENVKGEATTEAAV